MELADEAGVCVFRTSLVTMKFVNSATIILENEFAESVTLHGCMAVSYTHLEVNVGNEDSKFGFFPETLEKEWPELSSLNHLEIAGLMLSLIHIWRVPVPHRIE